MSRHHVVIIGSGFGGLFAAQRLKKADVDVTLISRVAHHLFQPLLYQVATGILSEGEIAPSTREVLARHKNVRVILGDVTEIDLDARTVTSELSRSSPELHHTTVTSYDSLIVAAGSGQSYFGNDSFAAYAPGMKTVDDALELRGRIFGAFEVAELAPTREEAERALTFVVVGAGPTGVEMAGQIAELSRRTLKRDFRTIDPTGTRVLLVDALPTVLPQFGDHLGGKAKASLERLGVEVQLERMVVGMDATGVDLKDVSDGGDGAVHRVEALTKIWAAGVQASPLGERLAEQSGADRDKSGRIAVEPDLTLPGHPEVFVVGDMITLKDYPGVAQLAIQGGRHAADQITKRVEALADGRVTKAEDLPAEEFEYFDKGSMATISRFSAVASVGPLKLTGFIAWAAWLLVHLVYIIGFKQQVTTLLHWAVSFIGRGRAERVTTRQQIFARNALRELDQRQAQQSVPAGADPEGGDDD